MNAPSTVAMSAAVRALEEMFQEVPDVMFCVKDQRLSYVVINDAFAARTPYGRTGRQKIIGHTAVEVFGARRGEQYEAQDVELRKTGKSLHRQLERIPNPSGTRMGAKRKNASDGYYLTTKSLLGEVGDPANLIISLSLDLNARGGGDDAAELVVKALDIIEANLSRSNLRPRDVAKEMNESLGQPFDGDDLLKLFKRVLRKPPQNCITERRREKAFDEITYGSWEMDDIWSMCGFRSRSAMNTTILARYNVHPDDIERIGYKKSQQ